MSTEVVDQPVVDGTQGSVQEPVYSEPESEVLNAPDVSSTEEAAPAEDAGEEDDEEIVVPGRFKPRGKVAGGVASVTGGGRKR